MRRILYYAASALIALGLIAALWIFQERWARLSTEDRPSPAAPERALAHYLRAVYARDYAAAYPWLSARDRAVKSLDEYLRENPSSSGAALHLARGLAERIEFLDVQSEIGGDRAILRFNVRLPDANHPVLQSLLSDLDPDRLAQLSESELQHTQRQINALAKEGKLPMLEGEERWEMIRESEGWWVFLDWSGAVQVRFEARVMAGLPWEFKAVQESVAAKPGETLQAAYRVKNLSDRPVTAKARHIGEPKELADKYLEIVQCFCFIQQTLAPGEERDLSLVFRVHWEAPEEVREFRVTYEFYPIDRFPED